MVTHIDTAIARRRAIAVPPRPQEPSTGLIETLGPIEDEGHILVLGNDGPDLTCALMRAGATRVTHMRSHERPEADSASLAIVPQVPSLDWLSNALPCVHRALHANGRLVIAFVSSSAAPHSVRRLLAQHGFSAIRMRNTAGRQLFSAELPSLSFRQCA